MRGKEGEKERGKEGEKERGKERKKERGKEGEKKGEGQRKRKEICINSKHILLACSFSETFVSIHLTHQQLSLQQEPSLMEELQL